MQHSKHRHLHSKKNSNIHWKNIEKILAAWIIGKRKSRAPQFTCNNNFANSIKKVLPIEKATINKQALFREWMPLAKDQASWMRYIENYFESCQNIHYQVENDTENGNENENETK